MTAPPPFETPRLILRPVVVDDAEAIQAVFPRWEIVRHLSTAVPWPYPDDGALTYIRDIVLPAMERGEAWHWSIRPKSEARRLIGLIGLMDKAGDNRGFWLDPAWQGQGLMSEAVEVVTDLWFTALDRAVLRVPKAVDNTRSRQISLRTGMRVIAREERDFVSGRLPAEIWEITRDEWLARQR